MPSSCSPEGYGNDSTHIIMCVVLVESKRIPESTNQCFTYLTKLAKKCAFQVTVKPKHVLDENSVEIFYEDVLSVTEDHWMCCFSGHRFIHSRFPDDQDSPVNDNLAADN